MRKVINAEVRLKSSKADTIKNSGARLSLENPLAIIRPDTIRIPTDAQAIVTRVKNDDLECLEW